MATAPTRKKKAPSSLLLGSDNEVIGEENKNRKKKNKPGQEIEDIFQAKKGKKRKESASTQEQKGEQKEKKPKKVVEEHGHGKAGEEKKSKTKKKKNKGEGLVNDGPEVTARRRRTADGFAIYSAEELGVGNRDAGDTPLCPFDCSCCF